MTEEKYQEFLKTAPEDHFSEEFIHFLFENNQWEVKTSDWLIIRNKKYWNPTNDWLTAFYIGMYKNDDDVALSMLRSIPECYRNREWLIKAPHKRTVKLFHVHLCKKS